MQSQPTIWPLGRDYNEAVQNPRNSFVDADLQEVVAAVDKFGMPTVSSGQFAYVFKLNKTTSSESLAARCFRGFVGERDIGHRSCRNQPQRELFLCSCLYREDCPSRQTDREYSSQFVPLKNCRQELSLSDF